jgi:hypothetical protein
MGSLGLLAWIQRLAARIEQLERGVALGNGTISNAKLSSMVEARIKGRAAGAGAGAPTDLTGTQATAILDAVVGDSGSGGTKGLVPAPAAGDAAAGKYLKADGTFAVPPGTGGSGDSTESTAYGSEALTGTGDLDFYTNSFYISRYNGATRDLWGPAYPFTAPSDTGFAWVNQGSASLVTANGGLVLVGSATGSGANLQGRVKTAPSAPYTITAFIKATTFNKAFNGYGLWFRESGTGEIHVFDVLCSTSGSGVVSGARVLRSSKYTNATTFSADYQVLSYYHEINWMRIADDNTNRVCSISSDGVNWTQVHSIGRTDFLTADQVGFFVSSENSAVPNLAPTLSLFSWKEA